METVMSVTEKEYNLRWDYLNALYAFSVIDYHQVDWNRWLGDT